MRNSHVPLLKVFKGVLLWLLLVVICASTACSGGGGAAPPSAPVPSLPAAPSGLTASGTTSSSVQLTWTDNASNELGFKLERSLNGTSSFFQLASMAANQVLYSDSGLTAATTYYYRVCAYNSDGVSAYSNTVTVITSSTGPPAAPSNLTASALSASAIALASMRNSTNETGFKIERGTAPAGPFTQVSLGAAGVTSFTDNGLATGTTYYYRVRATNSLGDSSYSNTASATTQSLGAPAAPSNLNASALSSSDITLTWTDNSTNESNFKLERSASAGGTFIQIALLAANSTSYTNSGLSAGTAYFYRIRATNATGDSAYSNTASATTPTSGPPAAPSNLTATATSSSTITLTWSDNSTNETGFKVERAPSATGVYAQVGTPAAGSSNYNDLGLAASTTYLYRVRATNASGDSAYSNTASATTQAPTPPAAPSNLVATTTSSSAIALTWNRVLLRSVTYC